MTQINKKFKISKYAVIMEVILVRKKTMHIKNKSIIL